MIFVSLSATTGLLVGNVAAKELWREPGKSRLGAWSAWNSDNTLNKSSSCGF